MYGGDGDFPLYFLYVQQSVVQIEKQSHLILLSKN
jgi:hypothetical protein